MNVKENDFSNSGLEQRYDSLNWLSLKDAILATRELPFPERVLKNLGLREDPIVAEFLRRHLTYFKMIPPYPDGYTLFLPRPLGLSSFPQNLTHCYAFNSPRPATKESKPKRIGGDVVLIRFSCSGDIYFLVGDSITPVIEPPSKIETKRAQLEEELKKGGIFYPEDRLGIDEFFALCLTHFEPTDYLPSVDVEAINQSIYLRMRRAGFAIEKHESPRYPGMVCVLGRIKKDGTIYLQGVGDLTIAVLTIDDSVFFPLFAQGVNIDRATLAVMEYVAIQEGILPPTKQLNIEKQLREKWFEIREHPQVQKWLKWSYEIKFGEIYVTNINGIPHTPIQPSWEITISGNTIKSLLVATDGLLYNFPQEKQTDVVRDLFWATQNYALGDHLTQLRINTILNSPPTTEKPCDDAAGLVFNFEAKNPIRKIATAAFSPEELPQFLEWLQTNHPNLLFL